MPLIGCGICPLVVVARSVCHDFHPDILRLTVDAFIVAIREHWSGVEGHDFIAPSYTVTL